MSMRRYYQLLELESDASLAEVKRAYRKLAFKYHPDHNASPDAHHQFISIQEAYSVLVAYLQTGRRPKTDAELLAESRQRQREWQEHSRRKRKLTAEEILKAREKRMREKAEQDAAIYQTIFDRFSIGWRATFNNIMVIFGLLLSIVVLTDFLQPLKAEKIFSANGDYNDKEEKGVIYIDGFEYFVERNIYIAVHNKQPITVYRTTIFKDVAKIRSDYRGVVEEEFIATMISLGPISVLFFLIPFFGFWYKRPDFNYTFYLIHYTMYIAPVLYLYFCLSNARIFHLFGIW